MPFIEILPLDTDWVKISPRYEITISKNLRDSYFSNGEKVGLFVDIENFLLGLKPQPNGYIISSYTGRIKAMKLKKYGLKLGKYDAQWDKKHGMVMVKLVKDES